MFNPEDVRQAYAAAATPAAAPTRKRKHVAAVPPPAAAAASTGPLPPIRFDEEVVRRAIAQTPRMELISTLLAEHPHTDASSGCGHATKKLVAAATAAAAAISRSRPAAADSTPALLRSLMREPLHPGEDVPGMAEFWRLRKRLNVPTYRAEGQMALPTLADSSHQLRTEAVSLAVYTAQHESCLLFQSGSFVFGNLRRVLPACRNGQQCITSTHWGNYPGLIEPIVLMRAMTPDQLSRFMATGVAPTGSAPCVLCHRESLAEYVHFMRSMTAQPHPQLRLEFDQHEVTQLWCNPINCASGYPLDYVLSSKGQQQQVTIAPVCEVHGWGITAKRMQDNGQWRLDQTQLVWRPLPVPVPHVGEKLADF